MENRRNIEEELGMNIECPPKIKRRSSFFGYNSVDSVGHREKNNKKEIEAYMKKLQLEFGEWPKNYVEIRDKLLNFWNKEPDTSGDNLYVSKEQQAYLEQAVDMNEYSRDSAKLCNQIKNYVLKKEWYLERYEFLVSSLSDKSVDEEIRKRINLKHQVIDSDREKNLD